MINMPQQSLSAVRHVYQLGLPERTVRVPAAPPAVVVPRHRPRSRCGHRPMPGEDTCYSCK